MNQFTRLGVLSFYFAAFVCRSNNVIKESKAALKMEKNFTQKKSTTDLYSAEKSSQNITNYFISSQPEILYTNCHIIIAVVDQF